MLYDLIKSFLLSKIFIILMIFYDNTVGILPYTFTGKCNSQFYSHLNKKILKFCKDILLSNELIKCHTSALLAIVPDKKNL